MPATIPPPTVKVIGAIVVVAKLRVIPVNASDTELLDLVNVTPLSLNTAF